MIPEMETRGGMGEEVEVGLEAGDPLFKLELLACRENILAVDNNVDEVEGSSVSGVLAMIPDFGIVPLSALSDSGTFGAESVATTGMEVKLHTEKKN